MSSDSESFVAFVGCELVGRGTLAGVVAKCKGLFDRGEERRIAVYDDISGHIVDVDLSGTLETVLGRLPAERSAGEPPRRRGPGRPRLGVVFREVSLLPRHWQWLAEQRGGASASLRRLVELAQKKESSAAISRRANIDAAYAFISDLVGNQAGFEEATRALFRGDFEQLERLIDDWPVGVREQLCRHVDRARPKSSCG